MNELMIHVERAVRPIQARERRKLAMRRELLAHLTFIYEEEMARHPDDEPAALRAALERFGEPAELRRELQASVPLWERVLFFGPRVERHWQWRKPDDTPFRGALRLATWFALLHLVSLSVAPVLTLAAGKEQPDLGVALGMAALVTGHAFVALLLASGVAHALLARPTLGTVLAAVGGAVAVLLAGVSMVAGAAVVQPSNPLWSFLLRSPEEPLALIPFACIAGWPLAATLILEVSFRYDAAWAADLEPWRRLEIGGSP